MNEISILTEQGKEHFDYIRWNKYVQKEIDGASDRAMVLICCAVLDAQLEKILNNYLIDGYEKQKKEIFNHNGALGSFSAKVEICFLCGLISKHERIMIDTIRKIRNKFAHEIELDNLDDEMVKNLCKNLSIPELMYVPQDIPCTNDEILKFDIEPFRDQKMRTRFVETFRYLSRYMERRIISIEKRKEYCAPNEIEILEDELEQMRLVFERKNELISKLKKIIDSDTIDESNKNDTRKLLEELCSKKNGEMNCSENQYMYYLQRILDTIKNSYGLLESAAGECMNKN